MMRRITCMMPPLLALALASCSDDPAGPGAGGGVSEAELDFARFSETAPPLATTEVSFWAYRDDNSEVEMLYEPTEADEDGEEFLEFSVRSGSLLHPDGTPFAEGDSVLITIRVVDADRFRFEFTPAGLRFDPERPAELEVSYEHAEPEDGGDFEESELAMWRQAAPGQPWFKVATVVLEDFDEVEADIIEFSQYALAAD